MEQDLGRFENIFEINKFRQKIDSIWGEYTLLMNINGIKSKLNQYIDSYKRKRQDLTHFQKEWHIIDSPVRGLKPKSILHSAFWVLFFFLVESIINAGALLDSQGGIDAYTISFALSLGNVGLGAFIGYIVLKHVIHRPSTRLLSIGGFILSLCVIVWANLVFMVYKTELAAINNSLLSQDALNKAVFPFDDLHTLDGPSALWVVVGLVFFIGSILKTYYSDDPRPGYGAKYRPHITARNDIEAMINGCRDDYQKHTMDTIKQSEAIRDEAYDSITSWSNSINRLERYFVDFEEWVKDLQREYKQQVNTCIKQLGKQGRDIENLEWENDAIQNSKDPYHVFSDVASHYKNDIDRLKATGEYNENISNVYADYDFKTPPEQINRQIDELETQVKKCFS